MKKKQRSEKTMLPNKKEEIYLIIDNFVKTIEKKLIKMLSTRKKIIGIIKE